jgi:hypothetical protein
VAAFLDALEEIDQILHHCRIELDGCAEKIRDNEELSSEKHIRNIGYALSYIFDIQHDIYKLRPELTPDYLK